MTVATVGFVGLGNMGSVLAANLVGAGHEVVSHDVAGPARNPRGRRIRRPMSPSWRVAPTWSC